ncbi:MAG: NAD(P)-dependent oxidoreductase [Burkholderiales bacterium]|nr:NAD(P)-dependent oxidoreductase [Burkholderiales bacterium]
MTSTIPNTPAPPATRTAHTARTGHAPAADAPGVRPPRAEIERRIAQAHPPLTHAQALVEAERCYYCHDAPCVAACPTGIDVPSFIARIAQGNLRGAAAAILSANPLGGMCARVCPTEVLCEDACVRHAAEDKPVEIGLLQRHATDAFFAACEGEGDGTRAAEGKGKREGKREGDSERHARPLFTRAPRSGRRIAVVGGGPAGLACAHGLACRGHDVVIFDARPKLGGLNEYGIAAYKATDGFAQAEVRWLLAIGGIEVRCSQALGREFTLDGLRADFDAVFLGLGLAGVNALGVPEPQATGLAAAVDFIAELRQAEDLSRLSPGRHVVVIGGGMTAVDAAVQSKMLGADTATIVYRRGAESMPASRHEQAWAQTQGVLIRHWAAPLAVLAEAGRVSGVRFAVTALHEGRLVETGETFTLAADRVLRAIGQTYLAEPAGAAIALDSGKGGCIATDAERRTSLAGVWAGGDCRAGGRDLTVEAVEDGKVAARSIDAALAAQAGRAGRADPADQAGQRPLPAGEFSKAGD